MKRLILTVLLLVVAAWFCVTILPDITGMLVENAKP